MQDEISILFAPSGCGKTNFKNHLVEMRIMKGLPTLDIVIEMSLDATLDSKFAIRLNKRKIEFQYDVNSTDSMENSNIEAIIHEYKKIRKQYSRFKQYAQYNVDSLNMRKLEKAILKAKKDMGLKPKDYLFVSIDLLTQMEEFNNTANKASAYEDAVNGLSKLVKGYKKRGI